VEWWSGGVDAHTRSLAAKKTRRKDENEEGEASPDTDTGTDTTS
jgi:hypothetical protein